MYIRILVPSCVLPLENVLWSASCPGCIIPGKTAPGMLRRPQSHSVCLEKRYIFYPCQILYPKLSRL